MPENGEKKSKSAVSKAAVGLISTSQMTHLFPSCDSWVQTRPLSEMPTIGSTSVNLTGTDASPVSPFNVIVTLLAGPHVPEQVGISENKAMPVFAAEVRLRVRVWTTGCAASSPPTTAI